MELSSFQIDEAAFNRQFRSWQGEMGTWFRNTLGEPVAAKARENAPKPGQASGRTNVSYATGKLANSIIVQESTSGQELEISVVANSAHAAFVHEGTRPHEINAKNVPEMIFFWHRVGSTVHRKKVNHPGTKPVPFLRDAMSAILERLR